MINSWPCEAEGLSSWSKAVYSNSRIVVVYMHTGQRGQCEHSALNSTELSVL